MLLCEFQVVREDFNLNYDVHEIVCGVHMTFWDLNSSACNDDCNLMRGDQIVIIETFVICDMIGNLETLRFKTMGFSCEWNSETWIAVKVVVTCFYG